MMDDGVIVAIGGKQALAGPDFMLWWVGSRIHRWYGELALLERHVATHKEALPIERWLQDPERIKLAVECLKTPTTYASKA
jgi:hypothetical protein